MKGPQALAWDFHPKARSNRKAIKLLRGQEKRGFGKKLNQGNLPIRLRVSK